MHRHILTSALVLTLATLVVAPAQTQAWLDRPTRVTGSPSAVDTDHVLALSLTADPVLDPALAWTGDDFLAIDQILVGLFRTDYETGEPIAELASSWIMSPDGETFTFTLRSDAYWTGGTPVTAYDIRNGILHALEPATDAPFSYILHLIHNAYDYEEGIVTDPNLVGIVASDATHLTFDLDYAASYLPSILAMPIARPIPPGTPSWTDPALMVTNGPYEVSAWSGGTSLTLVKNSLYYGASDVRIGEVEFSILDEAGAYTAYQAGSLDSAAVPLSEWSAAQADPELSTQLHISSVQCTYYYGFNTSKAPFNNVRVRKAFIAAVDRQGLIDTVLGYAQQPALTFTSPGVFGYVDGAAEGIGIPFSVSQAQAYLAAAGYPGGVGLPPVTLMFNTSPGHQAIAEYARQNWIDNLGVTVSLSSLPWTDYINLLRTDPPQIWRLGWCVDYREAHDFLYDAVIGNAAAYGSWSNPTYTGLLDLAAITSDLSTRAGLYEQAEEILVETDAVMLPIYHNATAMATQPYLERGYGNGASGGWIAEWRYWFFDYLPLVMRNAP
jgi:oligopeptide transport system substrate-binding protein